MELWTKYHILFPYQSRFMKILSGVVRKRFQRLSEKNVFYTSEFIYIYIRNDVRWIPSITCNCVILIYYDLDENKNNLVKQ